MVEFCSQCSIKLFGHDNYDLADLSTTDHTSRGLYPFVVCARCGSIEVDHDGRRIDNNNNYINTHEGENEHNGCSET